MILSFIVDKFCRFYRVYTIKSLNVYILNEYILNCVDGVCTINDQVAAYNIQQISIPCPIQRLIHQPVNPCQPPVGPAPLQLLNQQFTVAIMLHMILAVAHRPLQCRNKRPVFCFVISALPDLFRLLLYGIQVGIIYPQSCSIPTHLYRIKFYIPNTLKII